ncbi:MAG: hypothetical protein F2817_18370 [Actinobacteria bacterium]|nr:hypothetical protein [Actinomycetota bacterium]
MSFVNVNAAKRWLALGAFIVVIIIIIIIINTITTTVKFTKRENMTSDWNTAIASYDDDDCVSTWDQIAGGVQSLATGGSFKDIDRAKLIESDSGKPKYATCIKRTANYTLVCPSDTVRVVGCNGVTYKNSCYAERDGIYNYESGNGVVTN